jgi:ATP-dependent DNA helicase RecG
MSLTLEQLEALLVAGESDRCERKRNADDLDHIREPTCAFANDLPDHRAAGVLFIGVEDDGTSANIVVDERLLTRISQIRGDGNIAPFPTIEVRELLLSIGKLAVVIVQPSDNPPVRLKGRAYVRVGPTTRVATAEEEKRLTEKRRWANLPFDAHPVIGATLEELDLARFTSEYMPSLVSPDVLAQDKRTTEQQLRALRLVDDKNIPTTTAILMLAKSPQDRFPGATIAWRRVDGTKLTDATLDEKTITGTVADQLRNIDELMSAANSKSVTMKGERHEVRYDYPIEALQQLVRNGVMHRTYEGTTSPLRVTWYTDRVEILSPGGPYGAVTAETFGCPGITDYRNPTLSEALKGYGFVERFGQGLEIVRESLDRAGQVAASFQFPPTEAPTWVHVTLRKRT